uniref:MHC class II antigen n=1 Tax=Haemonchus contortus TaxID=6289 RepID=A0A7I4YJ32_HAECO
MRYLQWTIVSLCVLLTQSLY